MSEPSTNVVIAGAGPAGLALAHALAERGVRVIIADPAADRAWPNRYGAWARDLDPTGFGGMADRRWGEVMVCTGEAVTRVPGEYTQVDGARLRAELVSGALGGGARILNEALAGVEHHATGTSCHLAAGGTLQAGLVVDATGRGALAPGVGSASAFQTAYGALVRVRAHPWERDQAVLMDFGATHLVGAPGPTHPTFLYALPQSDEVVFVEETSLAAAPAVPFAVLQDRLHRRLAHLGIEVIETLDTERCTIPMDGAIPDRGRTVPFGAAAGYVHPATGYQLTRSLAAAGRVADAIVDGLGTGPVAAAERAWETVWPTAERRTRALHQLGLQLLLRLDAARTAAFFEAFFALPEHHWRAYLDATSPPADVMRAMGLAFVKTPGSLRRLIVAHAIGAGRSQLLAALTPQLGGSL